MPPRAGSHQRCDPRRRPGRNSSSLSFRHSSQRLLLTPASGYRIYTTGALTNVGTYGTCWASSPAAAGNVNAGDLWFHAERVLSLDSSGRANGFSVRCVQHLQAAFLPAQKRQNTFFEKSCPFLLTTGYPLLYICLVFRFGCCRKSAHLSIQNDNSRARRSEALRRLFSRFFRRRTFLPRTIDSLENENPVSSEIPRIYRRVRPAGATLFCANVSIELGEAWRPDLTALRKRPS